MFESNEIIASIHDDKTLEEALQNPRIKTLFLLYGDILTIPDIVAKIHKHHKKVFLHADFIKGLSPDSKGMKYVAEVMCPDGILSTRGQVIQYAKKNNLRTIQRLFLIDTNALSSGIKNVKTSSPDAVEVMPGLMPRVIRDLTDELSCPLVVGGLFQTKEEVTSAFLAGAVAVSSGSPALW